MNENGKHNIFICGFMATGKSTVGKLLAAKMHCKFFDMDALIEAEAGMAISQIFASLGEQAFRVMESRMVKRFEKRSGCVVATGGGVIVNPGNLQILKRCGVVITLTASVESILLRAGKDDTRPLLQVEDKAERIRTLMKQREPYYSQADIILDTSALSIDAVVSALADRLKEFGFSV